VTQTDGHDCIDSAVNADQAHIYFMGSATPPQHEQYLNKYGCIVKI